MTNEQLDSSLRSIIETNFNDLQEVKVLEAGCGSVTYVPIKPNYKITGIDISKKQLDRNEIISEKICGDIQTYPLEKESFDMIISWFVFEHLDHPEKAMQQFIQALKPNGLIILAMPNLWSVKGIITKFTPHVFHIWYYRYVAKIKTSGKNDMFPFKTFLKSVISPNNMKQLAVENNLKVEYFAYFMTTIKGKSINQLNPVVYMVVKIVGAVLWFFSFGKITVKNTDYVIVLRK